MLVRAGVLELLFGAEEGVEHGLAGILADHQGDDGADEGEQDQAAEAALLLRRLGRRSEASCRLSAASRRSFWTFLSLVTALTGPLPLPVARP